MSTWNASEILQNWKRQLLTTTKKKVVNKSKHIEKIVLRSFVAVISIYVYHNVHYKIEKCRFEF